jgi:hypothetical protein
VPRKKTVGYWSPSESSPSFVDSCVSTGASGNVQLVTPKQVRRHTLSELLDCSCDFGILLHPGLQLDVLCEVLTNGRFSGCASHAEALVGSRFYYIWLHFRTPLILKHFHHFSCFNLAGLEATLPGLQNF